MEELILNQKKDSPEIICKNGFVSMKGNSILSDPKAFFHPVSQWMEEYVTTHPESTVVDLNFDYVDTASVQSVFSILRLLKRIPGHEKSVVVNWHYELDDPELLEVGEIMQTRLKLNFNYIEQAPPEK
jgi:hypothetical protein